MKSLFFAILSIFIIFGAASAETLYVDDDGSCDGNLPCYAHPQDAVNYANSGDTILVYPGIYGSRFFYDPAPPHRYPEDQYAPALIVYKDGLTIEAVDPDPAITVIESTHIYWARPSCAWAGGAIEHSTGCIWHPTTETWVDDPTKPGDCVRPTSYTAPNAISIIASNVTIRGFMIHRHYEEEPPYKYYTYNTAGIMIGGLYVGDPDHLGSDNNTVENCIFSDVWQAVYVWHSSWNRIVDNHIEPLTTEYWAAISTYDGYYDWQVELGYPSENNLIANNFLANKGISLGAYPPSIWTSVAGSRVCNNTFTLLGVLYAYGPVMIGCNSCDWLREYGHWEDNANNVMQLRGISYMGDTEVYSISPVDVDLGAQLYYDGSADGSDVEVIFTVNGTQYPVITAFGGIASMTVNLGLGTYTVDATVTVCEDCKFTETSSIYIGPKPVSIDIKPGSDPNSINPESKGMIPVAILSTADFYAHSMIDQASLTFGRTGDENSLEECNRSPEDVNFDGMEDLICHFSTQQTGFQQGDTEGILKGFTVDGVPIEGHDSVNTVGQSNKEWLVWDPPTTNANGTPLTDLAGYRVYCGTVSGDYTIIRDLGMVEPGDDGRCWYSLKDKNIFKDDGDYYCVLTAYDLTNNESDYSNEDFASIFLME